MSSSSSRFPTRHAVLYVAVILTVLGIAAVPGTTADERIALRGPLLVGPTDNTTLSEETAQPDAVTQAESPPQSEESTEPEEKPDDAEQDEAFEDAQLEQKAEDAELEEESDADEPEDDSDANEAEEESAADEPDEKSGATKPDKVEAIGEVMAPGMIKLLQDEIVAGIKRRNVEQRFARFQRYAAGRLNGTAGKYTGSELTGNCRLRWYDHLLRNVLAAPAEAEQFTRDLQKAAFSDQDGIARVVALAAKKMDAGQREPQPSGPVTSAAQALDQVRQALTRAQVSYCAALAPLNKSEIRTLQKYLVPVLSTQNQVGHTLSNRGSGRQLCDIMEKMDREALYAVAEALAPIADIRLLRQLKSLPADGSVKVVGATQPVAARIDTPSGAIIIGSNTDNTYQLDKMRDVAVVIELGGNDTYYEGTVGTDRPVLVVIDLAGNDVYRGNQPGIQGGALLGASMLLDLAGDDLYHAQEVAQGSTLAGVGILVDYAGDDRYIGVRRVQGQAIGGLGLLVDRDGKDDYRAAMWAQGFGGPLGFGLLDDFSGDDHYFCGGMWQDSYPETPGMEGWGQGVGAGLRQVANGGIGAILDGGGDDVYEFDYLAHGGGYWCGLGFARDFGGNDQRLITRAAYNGGARRERSFQRFGSGWGCHYALGFLFDDAGDDQYEGTIMGTGMAWDCSMGVLCDFAGNDQYRPTGGLTQGTGAQMGFGILFDYTGDDQYKGYGQGYAPGGISYHDLPGCGGNFSFVVDYGGQDQYGCRAQNNGYIQRGDQGGFLIDRPGQGEVEPTATRPPSPTPAGS